MITKMKREIEVSIHVPAKGTTYGSTSPSIVMVVSIHVPAKGTTDEIQTSVDSIIVSIHVPAKGTTGSGSAAA